MSLSVALVERPPQVPKEDVIINNFYVGARVPSISIVWAVVEGWTKLNPKKSIVDLQHFFSKIKVNIYATAEPFTPTDNLSLAAFNDSPVEFPLLYKISLNAGSEKYIETALHKCHKTHEDNMKALERAGIVKVESASKLDENCHPMDNQEAMMYKLLSNNEFVLALVCPQEADSQEETEETVEDLLKEMKV